MSKSVLRRIDAVVEGDRDFLDRLRRVAALYGGHIGDLSGLEEFVAFVHKACGERMPADFEAIGPDEDETDEEDDGISGAIAGSGRRRTVHEPSYDPFD